ncbi:Tetratricopeptide TPR_2 repeat protein [Beijerinckia indica subsp. indica ATCC 9039]|uniref:Tetratricopeptide TPR_2 repeat protein n=2 Tax=Beijerinckia TaxID=532 RepID=B2IDD1_BEII9|nr:Tetratricopeptide TPR_2 repeat protein [Beijerinckia indica subsp. indica ATCC 9039]
MPQDTDQRILTVLEQALNPQIDFLRERLRVGYAKEAENGLRKMLATLPGEASPYVIFRIKANIGNCLAQLGDISGALGWFDEAVETAPREPKAIATRAFALILRKELKEAITFAQTELALDPNNEELAARLIDACISLDDGTDPEQMIPAGLKHREQVLLARCLHALQRDQQERWWSLARLGAQTYPESHFFKVLATEADVDEIARATRHEKYRALTDVERGKIQSSADVLEGIWLRIKGSEVPNREDGLSALTTCSVAYRLLEDGPKAIELAGELVDRSDYEPALILAVQIALIFNDNELVSRGLAKLPSQGAAGFFKGVFEFNKGNWSEAAQILREAEIPDIEKPFVAHILTLASLGISQDQGDEIVLDKARQEAVTEPRALIVIAKLAHRHGFGEVASRAYSDAVSLLGPKTSHPARITIASYAHSLGDYGIVISALDGHLDLGAITPELLQLSDAHALERPTRQRNMKFYERLTPAVRSHLRIVRGYASILTDRRRYSEAEAVLKKAIEAFPKDAYLLLKLIEIYRRTDRDEEIRKFIIERDETTFVGPPLYAMQWSHQLRDAGEFSRALSLAYQTLQAHPDDPQLALGYVGLILGDNSQMIIPNQTNVGQDCWVMIKDDLGRTDSFIIGHGPAILGIEVVSIHQERAKRLVGKKVNDSFETSDLGGQQRAWTIKEIKSKYLHVLHTVMQSFQTRFPSTPGLWGFTTVEGDIQPILDMVKAHADSQRKVVEELYLKGLPLAIMARSIGMDVTRFAYFIRSLGLDIVTANGTSAEFDKGISTAKDYRNAGAVLDEYTAIVAAEVSSLPLLKSWFGTLSVPASVIDELDAGITRAKADLGRTQLSLGFVRGEFVRHDINDEFLEQQINALKSVKQKIEDHCVIEPVTFPDTIPEEIADLYRMTGQRVLEPMYLAASRGDVLLSDDLHYRQIAAVLTRVDGTWLQAVVLAAQSQGLVTPKDQTNITVGLAVRRHGNIWLNPQSLAMYFDESTAEGFAALCHFIGNIGADMPGHTVVTARFLKILWLTRKATLERDARTSCILSALLRHRADDWAYWIAYIWIHGDYYLKKYILAWLRGHFLPTQPFEDALNYWLVKVLS